MTVPALRTSTMTAIDSGRRSVVLSVIGSLVLLIISAGRVSAESNWPRWRGPLGDGHVATKLPVRWDSASIAWKVPLQGIGQSSPIVWQTHIFLTSATNKGQQRQVLCLDGRDGSVVWEHTPWTGSPEPIHQMNSWASPSCVTDGEVVVAFFGKGGLHGYNLDGRHLWSRDLGSFECPWGVAACPVIVGDLVIQNGDADADSFIMGLNKRTGEPVWKTPHPIFGAGARRY